MPSKEPVTNALQPVCRSIGDQSLNNWASGGGNYHTPGRRNGGDSLVNSSAPVTHSLKPVGNLLVVTVISRGRRRVIDTAVRYNNKLVQRRFCLPAWNISVAKVIVGFNGHKEVGNGSGSATCLRSVIVVPGNPRRGQFSVVDWPPKIVDLSAMANLPFRDSHHPIANRSLPTVPRLIDNHFPVTWYWY